MLIRCAILCLLLLLTGCSSRAGRFLYHYHRTVVGVDISGSLSQSNPSGHLALAYQRRFVVFLPPAVAEAFVKAAEARQGPGVARVTELPPAVFCTQVKASLGGLNVFSEILATGDAAEEYAALLAASAPDGVGVKEENLICPGFVIPKQTVAPGPPAAVAAPPK
jgi:hypothetical protein